MPVENVQLDGGHGVELAQDDRQRHPVAADVDHETAPGEPGPVFDVDGGNKVAVGSWLDELQERVEAVQNPQRIGRSEMGLFGGHNQLIALVFIKRLHGLAGPLAVNGQNDRAGLLRFLRKWKRRHARRFRKLLAETIHRGAQARIRVTGQRGAEGLINGQRALALDGLGRHGHHIQRLRGAGRQQAKKYKTVLHFDCENFAGSKKSSGLMDTMRDRFLSFTSSAWLVSRRSTSGPDASRLRICRVQSRSTDRFVSSPSSFAGSMSEVTSACAIRPAMPSRSLP